MKRIATTLLIALVAQFYVPAAFSAVKAGSACSKIGTVATSGGKKFTCIKSGKKLVWDKGVIAKQTSSPKESLAPNTSPSSEPTVEPVVIDTKSYGWNFRFNASGILERRGGPVTEWSALPTRKGQVIDPIREKAFLSILNYSKTSQEKAGQVDFYFGPNVNSEVEKAYRRYFDVSINFFEARIPSGTVLDVIVGTEKDDAFFQSAIMKSLGNQQEATDLFERSRSMIHQFDTAGKNSSGGGSLNGFGAGRPLVFVGAVCSCFMPEDILMYNVPHEITHYFQFATTPNVRKQNFIGQYPNWTEGKIYIPSSLMEGSANTLGSALIVPYVGWYSDQMDWHLGRYKQSGKIKELGSVDETVKLMQTVESWWLDPSGLNELNYVLGQLIWEYFIAQYGINAFFDLFDNIEKFGDFESAIQKTVGITGISLYRDSAPYVIKAFNAVTP